MTLSYTHTRTHTQVTSKGSLGVTLGPGTTPGATLLSSAGTKPTFHRLPATPATFVCVRTHARMCVPAFTLTIISKSREYSYVYAELRTQKQVAG